MDINVVFAGLLVLFGLLQWRAIEKQNKQNLFKMRLEHCVNFNNNIVDMEELFKSAMNDKNDLTDITMSKFKEIFFKTKKIVPESSYLFNEEFYNLEDVIIKYMENILVAYEHKDSKFLEAYDENTAMITFKKLEILTNKLLKF